ncbi:MAG: hypothetical protein V4675_19900 [Verrucomicrobiota bacterium]
MKTFFDFSSKRLQRFTRLHSSTVRFYFEEPTPSDVQDGLHEVTFVYCLWELFKDRVYVLDADEPGFPDNLDVLSGETIESIHWIRRFSDEVKHQPPQLKVAFTNGYVFWLYNHIWESRQEPGDFDSPMMTIQSGLYLQQFLRSGEIRIGKAPTNIAE